jgi:3'-phosphoadenosine 5'-phosphosulfate sulfotransferase (PAPS reductase)/FAD synthetase
MSWSPYLIHGPATISFSGGRTSGFMLRQIIEAHGGKLPSEVLVVFCNTGLEHPKTYEFVGEVQKRWGLRIHCLEYTNRDGEHHYRDMDLFATHRMGEPFTHLIEACGYLPNPVMRKCTSELKIRTTKRFVRSMGWKEWTNVVGLRADEPRRVMRMRGDVVGEHVVMPMAEAGHAIDDVLAFWKAQPFDLELPGSGNEFGNCVGCFLKGTDKLVRLMRKEPELFWWWTQAEKMNLSSDKPSGRVFRQDRPTYAQLLEMSKNQGYMFEEDDTLPCHCTE